MEAKFYTYSQIKICLLDKLFSSAYVVSENPLVHKSQWF